MVMGDGEGLLSCVQGDNPHQLHPVSRYTKDTITKSITKRKEKIFNHSANHVTHLMKFKYLSE